MKNDNIKHFLRYLQYNYDKDISKRNKSLNLHLLEQKGKI